MVVSARFIWIRYGVVDVWRPELVTESSQVRDHPDGLSLLNINRNVVYTGIIISLLMSLLGYRPSL
jgi:hypothetical protein